MYFFTSVYFKTSEKKTPTDPDKISEETLVFQIYKQAVRKFALNFSLTIWLDESAFEPRPDFGGNNGGGGTNLGEVQRSSSRPPWKVRA
jgi:hypothetical protein